MLWAIGYCLYSTYCRKSSCTNTETLPARWVLWFWLCETANHCKHAHVNVDWHMTPISTGKSPLKMLLNSDGVQLQDTALSKTDCYLLIWISPKQIACNYRDLAAATQQQTVVEKDSEMFTNFWWHLKILKYLLAIWETLQKQFLQQEL